MFQLPKLLVLATWTCAFPSTISSIQKVLDGCICFLLMISTNSNASRGVAACCWLVTHIMSHNLNYKKARKATNANLTPNANPCCFSSHISCVNCYDHVAVAQTRCFNEPEFYYSRSDHVGCWSVSVTNFLSLNHALKKKKHDQSPLLWVII